MISVAAIGNSKDVNTFSGIPYHFFMAGKQHGFIDDAWEMDLKILRVNRYLWNIRQIASLHRPGGFQYSKVFRDKLYCKIPGKCFESVVISFNQHFPDAETVNRKGGQIYYYIDATFTQLLDRYGVRNQIDDKNIEKILKQEKDNYLKAKKIVTFQNWCKTSLLNDYKIPEEKIEVILPGANIITDKRIVEKNNTYKPGLDSELILGFIGKDWKRKGLEKILQLVKELKLMGFKVKLKCAGGISEDIKNDTDVDYLGFINKNQEKELFVDFVDSCHVGCLFSEADFSSISVLEFITRAKPVSAYAVDGMADLLPPDSCYIFKPGEEMREVAIRMANSITSGEFNEKQNNVYKWSKYYSWDRCISEWEKLLSDG